MSLRVAPVAVCLMAVLSFAPVSALALEFRSVKEVAPAYLTPSVKTKPGFVLLPGTPLEVVITTENWFKARDHKGDMFWVEKKFTSDRRSVIVKVDKAQVRLSPDEKASQVFEAERDVVLDILETTGNGWVKVKHRDGAAGFVSATQVWGY